MKSHPSSAFTRSRVLFLATKDQERNKFYTLFDMDSLENLFAFGNYFYRQVLDLSLHTQASSCRYYVPKSKIT